MTFVLYFPNNCFILQFYFILKLDAMAATQTNLYCPFQVTAAAAAKSLQSCPTPCDPRDSSPRGFPVPGILQARTLEWVAISRSLDRC